MLCSLHQGVDLKAEANAVMLAYERGQGQLEFVYFCDDEIESEKYICMGERISFDYGCERGEKDGCLKKIQEKDEGNE